MDTTSPPNDPSEAFVWRVRIIAHDSVVRDAVSLFERPQESVLFPHLTSEQKAQIEWYQKLDHYGRQRVQEIVRSCVGNSVFNFLVLLDNLTGGRPIPDVPSDYALFIHAYDTADKALTNSDPTARWRINDPTRSLGLHDEFTKLQKIEGEQTTGQTQPIGD